MAETQKHSTYTIDHLEADLALNYEESLNSNEKLELQKNAGIQIIKSIGIHLDTGIVDRVFPGLDIEKPEDYDWQESRIKFFYVDNDTYLEIKGSGNKSSGTFFRGQDYGAQKLSFRLPFSKPHENESKLEFKSEIPGLVLINIESYKNDDGSLNTKELNRTVRHEILHSLGIGSYLPRNLKEGLVTYLELLITEPKEEKESRKDEEVEIDKIGTVLEWSLNGIKLALTGSLDQKIKSLQEEYMVNASVFAAAKHVTKKAGWSKDKYLDTIIKGNPQELAKLGEVLFKNLDKSILEYFEYMAILFGKSKMTKKS